MTYFSFAVLLLASLFFALGSGYADDKQTLSEELKGEVSPKLKAAEIIEERNILRHRQIYFITGDPDTKVQFSLKLRLVEKWDLFFAYSQIMFWRTRTKSAPFRDVSYNPELFYRFPMGNGFWRSLDAGVEHLSNGKKEDDSRSLDRAFVQFNTEFGLGHTKIFWDTRFYYMGNFDKTNNDIRDYMGFWSTKVSSHFVFDAFFDKAEIYAMFYPGGTYSDRFELGGRELGMKIRFRAFGEYPYFFFQAYNGYSESLLNYSEFVKAYRVGFAL